MNMDRNNYETFFLLYVDNELNAEERQAVEAFAMAHPDLQEELQMLIQARLVPDESIRFESKELLYRHTTAGLSSEWEEKLLLYLDNELNPADRAAFETQLATNPTLQKELALYQQTIFTPDTNIVFPDKASLYKEEKEPARVIYFTWKRVAVAAVLLLTVSTSALLLLRSDHPEEGPAVAAVGSTKEVPAAVNNNNASVTPIEPANTASLPANESATRTPVMTAKKKDGETKNASGDVPPPQYLVQQNNGNNLPKPRYTSPVNDPVSNNNQAVYASNDPVNTTLTPERNTSKADPVESAVAQFDPSLSVNNGIVTNPSYASYNITDDGNKKSRGLLRKVTRFFEKTTNIQATTDDNKLLIGSFAVSLK